jgi:hypothetical protein
MRPWQSAAASVFYMFLPKITRGISDRAWHFPVLARLVAWHGRADCQRQNGWTSSDDVLDRYQDVAGDHSGEENTFKFYQMDISLLAISEK